RLEEAVLIDLLPGGKAEVGRLHAVGEHYIGKGNARIDHSEIAEIRLTCRGMQDRGKERRKQDIQQLRGDVAETVPDCLSGEIFKGCQSGGCVVMEPVKVAQIISCVLQRYVAPGPLVLPAPVAPEPVLRLRFELPLQEIYVSLQHCA